MIPECVIVLTTLPASAEEEDFARTLIDERLAACVNLLPVMQSVFRWQGTTEREVERQVVVKTTRARVAALRERIRELHPYEVPEFLVIPIVDGSEAYLRWVADSTAGIDPPSN